MTIRTIINSNDPAFIWLDVVNPTRQELANIARQYGLHSTSVEDSLGRYAPQITRIEVHLTDENGKKPGGDDKRCKLEARLSGLAPVGVTGAGDNLNQAVAAALEKLNHLLEHKLGRLSDKKGPSDKKALSDEALSDQNGQSSFGEE